MKRTIVASICIFLGAFSLSQTPAQSPPGCETNLAVLQYQVAWDELEVEVDNPTSTSETGGLVVDFSMNGHSYGWWFETTVPAETLAEWSAKFPGIISALSVSACDSKPDGIVDAPDPVANSVKQKNKGH